MGGPVDPVLVHRGDLGVVLMLVDQAAEHLDSQEAAALERLSLVAGYTPDAEGPWRRRTERR